MSSELANVLNNRYLHSAHDRLIGDAVVRCFEQFPSDCYTTQALSYKLTPWDFIGSSTQVRRSVLLALRRLARARLKGYTSRNRPGGPITWHAPRADRVVAVFKPKTEIHCPHCGGLIEQGE